MVYGCFVMLLIWPKKDFESVKQQPITCIHSDLQDDLAAIQDDEVRSRYCSQRLLCRSLAGNNVYVLTVSSPNTNEEVRDG